MAEITLNILLSIFLVGVTTIIYYEILRVTWLFLPKLKVNPRNRIIFVVMSIFAGHTIAVWGYAVVFYLIDNHGFGSLKGVESLEFMDYVYFSATTYSSLGIGDYIPTGILRFLTGVEVLNGLVLIGWSVSFTYLAMEKFWDLHPKKSLKK